LALAVACVGILAKIATAGRLHGIALAVALGRQGERAANIVKNTERIASATKTAAYRVPDTLNHATQVIGEVKNVARLAFTSQIQDFVAFAAQYGYSFELTIRRSTALAPEIQRLIADGAII